MGVRTGIGAVFVITLAVGVFGCGQDDPASDSGIDPADTEAQEHLRLVYRGANEAARKGLRCDSLRIRPNQRVKPQSGVVHAGPGEEIEPPKLPPVRGPEPPCRHPEWYPSPRVIASWSGSKHLHRLAADVAGSRDQVTDPRLTYVIADETDGESISIAERTREGTTWLLIGSMSGHEITAIDSP